MFIAGNNILLRAVEEELFERVIGLLTGKYPAGIISRLIQERGPESLKELLNLTGSRELAAGRLMAVAAKGEAAAEEYTRFCGLLLIEQADWKNGQLSISVWPEPDTETPMAAGLEALARFGFAQMRMETAVVYCAAGDQAAGEICRTAGMTKDACLRARLLHDGKRQDVSVWTLLKDEGGGGAL